MPADLPDLLARRAALTPDRIAIEETASARRLSYAGLDRLAWGMADMLGRAGVAPGDRVAVACRNGASFFSLLFACARTGAILVPLNWRLAGVELAAIIADADPRLIVTDRHFAPLAREAAPSLPVLALDDAREIDPPRRPAPTWPGDRIWSLLYTSGTTGRPKGVIQTFGMALANHVNVREGIDLRGEDRFLCLLPNFHTAGINLYALPVLFSGGCVLLPPEFDAGATLKAIGVGEVTMMFAVPTIYQRMADHPAFSTTDLSAIRHWGSGGASLPASLIATYAERGVLLCNGMGMTETGPTALVMDRDAVITRPRSIGRPQFLVEAIVADDHGPVPDGEAGEIRFRGPAITPGYWRNPQATREAFDADGWLRSGDIGRRDANGYFEIVGRSKDMFISGGENVYPAEVEAVLLTHPCMREAAVIGVDDRDWGESGHAFVVVMGDVRAADLVAHCRASLAGYKVPRGFTFVESLPRTVTGKVRKHELVVPSDSVAALATTG